MGPFHALGCATAAPAGVRRSAAGSSVEQGEICGPSSFASACRSARGKSQSEAHAALLSFLRQAQGDGAKFVLVITGKGGGARDDWSERGVLKRQVPQWLKLPEFRGYVVGFDDAHIGHGGQGALYVRIKRPRSRTRTS